MLWPQLRRVLSLLRWPNFDQNWPSTPCWHWRGNYFLLKGKICILLTFPVPPTLGCVIFLDFKVSRYIEGYCQFWWYLTTLYLKFQKAWTKIEVVLTALMAVSVFILIPNFWHPLTCLPCLVNVFKERPPRQATLLFPTIIWAPLALVPS